jgi:hypothetical protein
MSQKTYGDYFASLSASDRQGSGIALQKIGCGSMFTAAAFVLQANWQSHVSGLPPSDEGGVSRTGRRRERTKNTSIYLVIEWIEKL